MRSMPRCCAAAAPSTQTGWCAVAALRYVPANSVVPTALGRPRLEASTLRPLVLTLGIFGFRNADALVVPVYWVAVTGPMREIMAGADFGSSAVWPNTVWPF